MLRSITVVIWHAHFLWSEIAQKSRIRELKQAYLHTELFHGGAFRSAGNDLLRTADQHPDEFRTYREGPV